MLIDFKKLDQEKEMYKAAHHEVKAARYLNENVEMEMGVQLGSLRMGEDIHFASESRWNLHDLIVYCLKQTGPADLYFCTYAIKEYQARLFAGMKNDGLIKSLNALVDYRFSVHDADAEQIIKSSADRFGTTRTHAKLTVLRNESWGVVITGSANLTANTKADVGVVTCDFKVADYRIDWITKKINHGINQ